MNKIFKLQAKKILTKILPDSVKLQYLSYLPKLETFRKTHLLNVPTFEHRYKMYDFINKEVVGLNNAIDYFEFGVFEGKSIKYWVEINSAPNSRFFGFDTFSGLPETWHIFTRSIKKNTFDMKGTIPDINDSRVEFIKGLFQDTLPKFLLYYKNKNRILIHNDSDLYSSTLFVLTFANNIIVPGTIIIFDEFSSILSEFRALEDYCLAYGRNYEVVGATLSPENYFSQIAIMINN